MEIVLRTRTFTRWMRKTGLTDQALYRATLEMTQGLIDTDLGGHVLKKRVALPGQGKRGSVRTLVATRRAGRWVFIYGFNKNERANIDAAELKVLQELARDLLGLDEAGLAVAVAAGELMEVRDGSQQA